MNAGFTPGPWELCAHLASEQTDADCHCGYRGVIYGPEDGVAMAICQPGHDPAPEGQDGTQPGRYPRATEVANARLIAAAPDLYEACRLLIEQYDSGPDFTMGGNLTNAPFTLARAAIAKATGQQP